MPMPSGVGLTHGQIWRNFLAAHGGHISESELRRIHHKWINTAAEVGWRDHDTSRSHAPVHGAGRSTDG